MSELKLEAQPRSLTGRKVRQLRTQGLVPVVVYGNKQAPVNLQVSARNLAATLRHGGISQLVQVDVEGGDSHNVLVREIQRHPTTHAYIHVDLYAVSMTEKQHANVPVSGTGRPDALVTGFSVIQERDTVEVEALPSDLPANIEVDITALEMDRPITIADLPALPGVEYLGEPTESLFVMLAPRVQEEEEEEVEEVEGMEEPEVVARGGADEDEEAEGEE